MGSWLKKSFGIVQDATSRVVYGREAAVTKMSFYDCIDKKMNGDEVKMSEFRGQVLLLVNVASA